MMLTKDELRAQLPQVGDRRMEDPTAAEDGAKKPHPERPCRVIYVNPRHLWYMVQFANGLRECYKVPAGGAMG